MVPDVASRMSLGQTMHRHAGQLDTTGRIQSLPKGRPDIEDSHDPRIGGLAVVDTAVSVDTFMREDLLIIAVEGEKETRVDASSRGMVVCVHQSAMSA
jgi:hypothetical protein